MKKHFGFKKGEEVSLYTLENDNVIMSVTDLGAALVSLIDKETGIDVVLGFDTAEEYQDQGGACLGASVGRTANRTEKGMFTLNGKTYHLPINNGPNSIHGGLEGFDQKIFAAEETENSVIFTRLSPDGEEGYPGNLEVKITYTLLDDGVSITAEGTADQDTLFAYTNHSYFNVDGTEDAMGHEVRIFSDEYALSDEDGMMRDVTEPVEGTPFDFREFTSLGSRINEDNEQLILAKGYDHHYPIPGTGMRNMVECRGEKLILTMASDFPGMHLYTANFLFGQKGKYGHSYPERAAVCFEAEYYPNAVNYEDRQTPLVRAGETLRNEIRFTLKKRS